MTPPQIEVCVTSVNDALTAQTGGADRVELCTALDLGGVTPSLGLLREVLDAVRIPVIVLVRPRLGNFHYCSRELRTMLRDIESALTMGAAGIAVGVMTGDRTVDIKSWQTLSQAAQGRDVVFHRAFDLLQYPEDAMERLVDCGTTRILTSGGKPTAHEGIDNLIRWNRAARGRIEILPGGGITSRNVREILDRTACGQVHGSFSEADNEPDFVFPLGKNRSTSLDQLLMVRQSVDRLTCTGPTKHPLPA